MSEYGVWWVVLDLSGRAMTALARRPLGLLPGLAGAVGNEGQIAIRHIVGKLIASELIRSGLSNSLFTLEDGR